MVIDKFEYNTLYPNSGVIFSENGKTLISLPLGVALKVKRMIEAFLGLRREKGEQVEQVG